MDRVSTLAQLGLQELIVSVDDYHLRFVPICNIRRVVHAALALGIRVGVNVLVTRTSIIRKSDIPNILNITVEQIQKHNPVWVRESSPVLVGRARSHVCRRELQTYGEAELLDNPCYFVVRNMVMTPEESVYACCGFGDASDCGPASIAYVGDFRTSSIPDIFETASHNLILNMIFVGGPYRLLKMAKEVDPSIRFPKRYVSNCDICGEISRNPRLRRAISQLLRGKAASVHPIGRAGTDA